MGLKFSYKDDGAAGIVNFDSYLFWIPPFIREYFSNRAHSKREP